MSDYPHLFAPISIGTLSLDNRVVMSPMATNLAAVDGSVTDDLVAYYSRRAQSRPGLLTVEMSILDFPRGKAGTVSLRIDTDEAVPGLRRLVEAVDFWGVPIALQLGHAGGNTTLAKTRGEAPIGPSATRFAGGRTLATEADAATLEALCVQFGEAAGRARRAGFSAVNLHGGHTYLLAQMLSPLRNQRTDEWGGDLDRRMRFATRAISEIQRAAGADFPIIYRFSADEFLDGGRGLDESLEVARRLESLGVAMLDVTAGASGPAPDLSLGAEAQWKGLRAAVEPMSFGEAWKSGLAGEIRKVVSIPVSAVGVIRTPATAERILVEGTADVVTLGRALIADPDWLDRARAGAPERIRPCISCNECSRVRQELDRPIRCAVNPDVGRERLAGPEALRARGRLIVVGGGAAGLEAARQAALSGLEVEVWEAADALGGQLIWGAVPPFKYRLEDLRQWLVDAVGRAGVTVRTNTEASVDTLVAAAPDAVVVAVGVDPVQVSTHELTAYDLLRTGADVPAGPALVVGGGPTGCEAAMFLAERGHPVRLASRSRRADLARGLENLSRADVRATLDDLGVEILESTDIAARPGGVLLRRPDRPEELWTGTTVWASGVRSRPFGLRELRERLPHDAVVVTAGDSRAPRNILHAVADGAAAAASVVLQLRRATRAG